MNGKQVRSLMRDGHGVLFRLWCQRWEGSEGKINLAPIRSRLIFSLPMLSVFLCDRPFLWWNFNKARRMLWLFVGWIHLGVKL